MTKLRSVTLLLPILALIGMLLLSLLILKWGGPLHLKRESSGIASQSKLSEVPLFPPELKEVFITLLPTEEEVKMEINRFKEARDTIPKRSS